ncbi:MAG: ATP-binding cassette domain-containing protein [Caldilineaceae bacterium]
MEPTGGSIHFHRRSGKDIDMMALSIPELRYVQRYMGMIFQDPYSSLNPRMTVLEIIGEPFITRNLVKSRRELEDRVAKLLQSVRLDPTYMRRYPHAFSGGQRQRIAIARALALDPEFVVADEPISALDVSVQAQILSLLRELQTDLNLTYLFITHNLAVVEYISDRVAVMYVGQIVELGDTAAIFSHPRHPYTEALLSAVPVIETDRKGHTANAFCWKAKWRIRPMCRRAAPFTRAVLARTQSASEEPPLLNVADMTPSPLRPLSLRSGTQAKGVRGGSGHNIAIAT